MDRSHCNFLLRAVIRFISVEKENVSLRVQRASTCGVAGRNIVADYGLHLQKVDASNSITNSMVVKWSGNCLSPGCAAARL
jgi:succinyl-CoA synthetase beta subunit